MPCGTGGVLIYKHPPSSAWHWDSPLISGDTRLCTLLGQKCQYLCNRVITHKVRYTPRFVDSRSIDAETRAARGNWDNFSERFPT